MLCDLGVLMIYLWLFFYDVLFSFKFLRNILLFGGEVGEKFGFIICERNENVFYYLRVLFL